MVGVVRSLIVWGLIGWVAILAGWAQQVIPRFVQRYPAPAGVNLFAFGAVEDAKGRLWLATDEGIVQFDGRRFRVYQDPIVQQGVNYFHLAPSPDGRIWCSTGRGTVLSYIDLRLDRLVRVPDSTRLVREFIDRWRSLYVFADTQGKLWISLRSRNVVIQVNPKTFAVEKVLDQPDGIVHWITQDKAGRIWFNTYYSVYGYDPLSGKLKQYQPGPKPDNRPSNRSADSMTNRNIVRVHARADGTILVGMKNEVDLIDPATDRITRIPLMVSKFYPEQATYHFNDDWQGNTYFRTKTACYRYTRQGELQKLEFSTLQHPVVVLYPSRHHRLWLVAGQSLLEYDLDRIWSLPPLNLIDVEVNRARLDEPSDRQQLVRDSTGHPTLRVEEGDLITLRVAPTVQRNTGKLAKAFRYRIEDYQDSWYVMDGLEPILMDGKSYSLPAGRHTFALDKAIYPLGWKTNVSTMSIVVVPPYWKTVWFWLLVLSGTGGVGGGLRQSWNRRRKLRQELARQEFETASLRELDEMKSRFFANITHELRTPLTIILNAHRQLSGAPLNESNQKQLHAAQRNAQQLMRLINETLDMAKLDAGKLEHRERTGNPLTFVEQMVAQFAGLADQKHISLKWLGNDTTEGKEILYQFDSDNLEKITYNLLANALKFTPTDGQVQVDARIDADHHLVCRVIDTGIGIANDQLPRIFERFHQVDSSSTRAYSGTGIGLALVKELTEWLGGMITVDSALGQGSTFTVRLPLRPSLAANAATQESGLADTSAVILQRGTVEQDVYDPMSPEGINRPLLLVVEDNVELRSYMTNALSDHYRTIVAENGRLGLEQALKEVPDLIISDVMMPELNGYDLVEHLKTDERTSHIPVVLLTAKSSSDSRLKGLGAGADDYIEKPFNIAELRLRIGNCLRTRQQWQRHLTGKGQPNLASPPDTPNLGKEERFLTRLQELILNHLTDDAVDVDWLVAQAGMSRTQLHRKLTALTGLSSARFIHKVRLEKAVELLQLGQLNVAQVAQQVGYNSQSYFTKMFQEHFGYSPIRLKE